MFTSSQTLTFPEWVKPVSPCTEVSMTAFRWDWHGAIKTVEKVSVVQYEILRKVRLFNQRRKTF